MRVPMAGPCGVEVLGVGLSAGSVQSAGHGWSSDVLAGDSHVEEFELCRVRGNSGEKDN